MSSLSGLNVAGSFNDHAKDATPRKQSIKVKTIPLTFRVLPSERDKIRALAGSKSMSEYVRDCVLGHHARRKRSGMPSSCQKTAARILGLLGESGLSSSLERIARSASMGALPLTEDVISDITQACADIRAMHRDLIAALGIKPHD